MMRLSQLDIDLWSMPSVAEQLPIVLQGGTAWSKVKVNCSRCGFILTSGNVRGRITQPTLNIAIIEARGYCHQCVAFTRIQLKVSDGKQVSSFNEGRWVRHPRKTNFRSPLKKILRLLGR